MITATTYGGARIRYNDDAYEEYRGADTDPTPADRARNAARMIRAGVSGAGLLGLLYLVDGALDKPVDVAGLYTAAEIADAIDAAADAWEEAQPAVWGRDDED